MMQREQADKASVNMPGAFLGEAIRATIQIAALQARP